MMWQPMTTVPHPAISRPGPDGTQASDENAAPKSACGKRKFGRDMFDASVGQHRPVETAAKRPALSELRTLAGVSASPASAAWSNASDTVPSEGITASSPDHIGSQARCCPDAGCMSPSSSFPPHGHLAHPHMAVARPSTQDDAYFVGRTLPTDSHNTHRHHNHHLQHHRQHQMLTQVNTSIMACGEGSIHYSPHYNDSHNVTSMQTCDDQSMQNNMDEHSSSMMHEPINDPTNVANPNQNAPLLSCVPPHIQEQTEMRPSFAGSPLFFPSYDNR